jgi:hypothetical protein
MLVGFSLGIFYGFDGWRGSTDEIEFKESPRVKNLIWILTAALASVIGDGARWESLTSIAQKNMSSDASIR